MLARRVFYTIIVLLALFVAFVVTGRLAPEVYESSISVELPDRQIDIWRHLVSLETITVRKPDVERVVQVSESYEAIAWQEILKNGGSRTLRVVERDAPSYFKIERFQSTDGVTGTWTFYLEEQDHTTVVYIDEVSLNKNLWKRAWYTIRGRDVLLKREVKSLRVALFSRLIETP